VVMESCAVTSWIVKCFTPPMHWAFVKLFKHSSMVWVCWGVAVSVDAKVSPFALNAAADATSGHSVLNSLSTV